MATRFIRVRGRVVPIKDKSERKGYGTSAAIGAGSAAALTTGAVATTLGKGVKNIKAIKFGFGLRGAGAIASLAGLGYAVNQASAAGIKEKSLGRGTLEFVKHNLASTAGTLLGVGATTAFIRYRIKRGAAIRAAASIAKKVVK